MRDRKRYRDDFYKIQKTARQKLALQAEARIAKPIRAGQHNNTKIAHSLRVGVQKRS